MVKKFEEKRVRRERIFEGKMMRVEVDEVEVGKGKV